jgi:hypothetical protein
MEAMGKWKYSTYDKESRNCCVKYITSIFDGKTEERKRSLHWYGILFRIGLLSHMQESKAKILGSYQSAAAHMYSNGLLKAKQRFWEVTKPAAAHMHSNNQFGEVLSLIQAQSPNHPKTSTFTRIQYMYVHRQTAYSRARNREWKWAMEKQKKERDYCIGMEYYESRAPPITYAGKQSKAKQRFWEVTNQQQLSLEKICHSSTAQSPKPKP